MKRSDLPLSLCVTLGFNWFYSEIALSPLWYYAFNAETLKIIICKILSWVSDGWDIVDAGHSEHVEDDVSAGDDQHGQEDKDKTCQRMTNPTASLTIANGKAWYEPTGINWNTKYDNDQWSSPSIGQVSGEI